MRKLSFPLDPAGRPAGRAGPLPVGQRVRVRAQEGQEGPLQQRRLPDQHQGGAGRGHSGGWIFIIESGRAT